MFSARLKLMFSAVPPSERLIELEMRRNRTGLCCRFAKASLQAYNAVIHAAAFGTNDVFESLAVTMDGERCIRAKG